MIEREAGFARSTDLAGRERSRHGRRSIALLGALAGVLALALVLGAGSASAKLVWQGQYAFGIDGTSGTSFENAVGLALQQDEQVVYVYATSPSAKIYKYKRLGPGEYTPLGGNFPVSVANSGGDPEIDVDDTDGPTKGNLYYAASTANVYGFGPTGIEMPEYKPAFGEKCGVSVDGNGKMWVGNYGGSAVEQFAAGGGEPLREVKIGPGQPCSTEIDTETNEIYVGLWNDGVYRLSPSDDYSTATPVPNTTPQSKIAVDASADRLYVYSNPCCWSDNSVLVFDTTTLTEIERFKVGVNFIKGIAVDEASHTLFLTSGLTGEFSGGQKVQEWRRVNVPLVTTGGQVGNEEVSGSIGLDGGGEVEECWLEYGTESNPDTFAKGPACDPAAPYLADQPSVTADLTGTLTGETTYYYRFAANNSGGIGYGDVESFTPHNVSFLKTDPASNITRTEARLNGSYEGTNEETEYWFEWRLGTSGTFTKTSVATETTTTGPTALQFDLGSLTAGKTYTYRVAAKNSKGESLGEVVEFQTSPAVKNVVTEPATDVSNTEATLHGSLDPDGFATTYYFEWGKDTTYGAVEPLDPVSLTDTSPGDQDVSAQLTNLEPGVEYHFRLTATNSFETTVGIDQTFTTPEGPAITSFNAVNLTASSADLVATINPNGHATEYWFEYGLTPDYGTTVPVPNGELPPATTDQEVLVTISGLEERTYHFRVTAKSERGEVVTEDQSFNFNVPEGCPNKILRQQTGSAYTPDCRAYELVSARNTNGTTLAPGGPTSPTADGKFGYTGFLNQIPESGEPQTTAFGVEPYLATRTVNGWKTRYMGVPGSKAIGQSSNPGLEYGGAVTDSHCYTREEEFFSCGVEMPEALPHDSSLEHVLVWNRHQVGILGGPKDGTSGPEVYDNEGNLVGQLPTNMDEVPGAEKTLDEGGWIGSARISADYSHYAFSSIRTAFAAGGLVDPPGSVYDNDLRTDEVHLVSKRENGEDIQVDPKSPLTEEYLRVPAISDDGTHILISSAAPTESTGARFTRNVHLYMAVNEGGGEYAHYDITIDKNGKNVGVLWDDETDDITADGKKVFFITHEQMTSDDTDTSRDLFEWNEDRARNDEEPLVKVSTGDNGAGDTDDCDPVTEKRKTEGSPEDLPWTVGLGGEAGSRVDCSVKYPLIWPGSFFEKGNLFDTRLATETGELYFYSPERLEGARGFPNKRNLYVWRNGKAQFVATFEPTTDGSQVAKAAERINVTPDGDHMAVDHENPAHRLRQRRKIGDVPLRPGHARDQMRLLPARRQTSDSERRRLLERALHELRRPHLLVDAGFAHAPRRQQQHRRLRVRRRPAAADHHGNQRRRRDRVAASRPGRRNRQRHRRLLRDLPNPGSAGRKRRAAQVLHRALQRRLRHAAVESALPGRRRVPWRRSGGSGGSRDRLDRPLGQRRELACRQAGQEEEVEVQAAQGEEVEEVQIQESGEEGEPSWLSARPARRSRR